MKEKLYNGKKISPSWRPIYSAYVFVEAAKGLSNDKIASRLGLSPTSFNKWIEDDETDVRLALKEGRKACQRQKGIEAAVIARFGELEKMLWESLTAMTSQKKKQLLLNGRSDKVKQSLFIRAFMSNGYNKTLALHATGISHREFQRWQAENPSFGEMLEQAIAAQDDWYESKFINLVEEGDSAATVHAAKTRLSKRGYGTTVSMKVEHSGTVSIQHHLVSFDRMLNALPEEKRVGFLETANEAIELLENPSGVLVPATDARKTI